MLQLSASRLPSVHPRPRGSSMVAVWVFVAASTSWASEFTYRLRGPEEIRENQTFEVAVELDSEGIPAGALGVEGWQLAVAHRGVELLELTYEDTAVEDYLGGGFAFLQPTEGAGNAGFVSGVVLSLDANSISLPPNEPAIVARARYIVRREACETGAAITVRDGLATAGGGEILNRISQGNLTHDARLTELDYTDCRLNSYRLELVPSINPIVVEPGRVETLELAVVLEQAVAATSGWTLAVAHDPDVIALTSVSLEGTSVEEHLEEDSVVLHELTSGPGNAGFVARVDVSNDALRSLPGTSHVLARATYRLASYTDLPAGTFTTRLRLAEVLRGSGGPFSNEVRPRGFLDRQETLDIVIHNRTRQRFVRGDSNADGRLDVGDPLTTLFHLFAGLDRICREAANANGDPRLDATDAVHALRYLFVNGPPPAPPFPECGGRFTGFDCAISRCP